MDYQLIVIGAGPGGYTAALRAAALGLRTSVVECRQVGGTCLNRGCIPTKTLLHASQVYRDAVDGASMGIHAANATFDMGEIFAYKRGVSEKLRNGIHGLLKSAKVDLIEGVGRIAAPGQVDVTAADGAVSRYTAERILIATGSVNVRPPISGLDLPGVMTSDELLEGCDRLYDSLVIIGGGVIGVEFATFYRNLGCAVALLEGMDRLLPNMDRELGQNLQQIMKKQGVEVLTNAMVQSLEQTESGLAVHVLQKGAEKTVTGDEVYGGRISRSVSRMEHDEQTGMDPAAAGRFIARVAQKTSHKPIYTIRLDYQFFVFLKRILPYRALNALIGLIYAK